MALLWAHPAAACTVERRASVAVSLAGGLVLLPVAINGAVEQFVLDTGAERSVVGLAAADRLKLARDEWVSTDIQGAGGVDRRRLGRPSSLLLDGMALRRRTVAADQSVVVGPLPAAKAGRPVAGRRGPAFHSPYDLELDIPAGRLSLYAVSGCAGRFLPWTDRYAAIPAWRPVRNVLAVALRLGGVTVQAELDSGAQATTLTLPGMVQLGLAAGGPDQVRGFGPGSLAARAQHFPAVQVGNLPAAPAELAISPIRTLRSIGALLGADWLASRRVWVSWATDQVFVAE